MELAKEDRKATMNSIMRLADSMSEDEKASLIGVLQPSSRSSG